MIASTNEPNVQTKATIPAVLAIDANVLYRSCSLSLVILSPLKNIVNNLIIC